MSDADARTVREEWGSRFGFLIAMLGAMVGAGNIWRMPYVTGQNGGGAFLLTYVILLFVIAIPGLMAETVLGHYTNRGVIGSFRSVFGRGRAEGWGWSSSRSPLHSCRITPPRSGGRSTTRSRR